jgi:hypothetical protein
MCSVQSVTYVSGRSIFRTFEDEIEWFSVCGREVYAIGRAVQKHGFEELAPFAVIAGKVQRMSTMREFQSPLRRKHAPTSEADAAPLRVPASGRQSRIFQFRAGSFVACA